MYCTLSDKIVTSEKKIAMLSTLAGIGTVELPLRTPAELPVVSFGDFSCAMATPLVAAASLPGSEGPVSRG